MSVHSGLSYFFDLMTMNKNHLSLLLALSLSLAACTTVRQTKPLAYAGDARSTVGSLEVAIQKRGYKPICKEREYCKFQYGQEVWVHFKTSSNKAVMAVDVVDGKKMPADKRKALTDEASAVGDEIWREASADAQQREKAAADKEKAEAAARAEQERKEKEEEERKAAEKKTAANDGSSGGGIGGLLTAVGGAIGGGKGQASAQANTSSRCCINHAYYQCPSLAAVNKCAGETAACLGRCAMSGGMGCEERCLKENPPDPSDCERHAEKDGECR